VGLFSPPHPIGKLFGIVKKPCTVLGNKAQTALALLIGQSPRKSKHLSPIRQGLARGDKTPSFFARFDDKGGVGPAGNDAVTPQKIGRMKLIVGPKLR